MGNFILDLYRALLFLMAVIRWGISPAIQYMFGLHPSPASVGVRLRRMFESMGITYNKIGQYLAMRFDILPPEICRELGRLFESVPPMGFGVVHSRIEIEIGAPPEQFFLWIDPQPIGAASIAQVHKARTVDGELVAIKIQRPRIQEIFRADMRNLHRLAWVADRLRIFGDISLTETIDEIADFTVREMDFVSEGRTMTRLYNNPSPYCYLPRIRWDLTTPRMLTMEYIEGASLLKVCSLVEEGNGESLDELLPDLDLDEVVNNLARACLHQLFVAGLFHGDPHPGNILIDRTGAVVFIDAGIFGELTAEEREMYGGYIENLVMGNLEEAYRRYSLLTTFTPRTDIQKYKREIISILGNWYSVLKDPTATVEDRHTGKYQGQIVEAMRRNHVRTQPNQLLFWRVLVVLDATALRLPIHFDLLTTMSEFFRRIRPRLEDRLATLLADEGRALTMAQIGRNLPGRANRLLGGHYRRGYAARVRSESSPEVRRAEDRVYRRAALLLVALCFQVLAINAISGQAARSYAIGLALVFIIIALFRHGD